MARTPSEATQLRNAKATLRKMTGQLEAVTLQRDSLAQRVVKAEREAVQWKERFDLLLQRDARASLSNPIPADGQPR